MTRSRTISRALQGELCSGCGLCASLAPDAVSMETVAPGYARPFVRRVVTSEAERAIAASCPAFVVEAWSENGQIDPYWGPWRRIGTGYATDARLRFEASSGGALSALAIHALETGLVKRIVHVKADPDAPTRNILTCSASPDEILSGAGSRYAPSSPLSDIDRLLSDGGGPIAFVGKPCDVSALRRLARVDSRVEGMVPVFLSFFCGGTPSHDGADRVTRAMGLEPKELVEFRYRGRGWPGQTVARTREGATGEMPYAQSWGDHLSKQIQFRCKICPDAVGGTADVACADAWYGDEDGYPSFEEQDGRSLIMARSVVGDRLVTSAIAAGVLELAPLDVGEINRMQPAQARRKRLVAARLAAMAATLQPRPKFKGVRVHEAAAGASVIEQTRNFFGVVRRIATDNR